MCSGEFSLALNAEAVSIVKRGLYPLLVMVGDLFAFYLSLLLAYLFRIEVLSRWVSVPLLKTFRDLVFEVWIPGVVLVVFLYEGLYTKRKPFWEETRTVVGSLFLAYLAIFSIVSLGKLSEEISRAVIVGAGFFSLLLVPLVRARWKPILHGMGFGLKKMLLFGDENIGKLTCSGLSRDHYMGFRVVGSLSMTEDLQSLLQNPDIQGKQMSLSDRNDVNGISLACLGSIQELKKIVYREGVRGAIVAFPQIRREQLSLLIERLQRYLPSVYVIPNVAQVSLLNSELLYLFYEELFILGIHNKLKFRVNRWIKSISDIFMAILLFIPLAPALASIAVLVAISSRGPIFFKQRRVGRGGRVFHIYKFRTMYDGAEERLKDLLSMDPDLHEEYTRKRKLKSDPRITPIGRILRRTSLDEVPQIINVLKGEMSFVGPRPAMEDEMIEYYGVLKSEYGLVKPGITGLWQVSGRSNNDFSLRVRLDLWYIRNWSLWLDFIILIRTVGVVLFGRGAV